MSKVREIDGVTLRMRISNLQILALKQYIPLFQMPLMIPGTHVITLAVVENEQANKNSLQIQDLLLTMGKGQPDDIIFSSDLSFCQV